MKAEAREAVRLLEGASPVDQGLEEPFKIPKLTARELCELPEPPKTDQLLGELVVRGQRVVIGGQTGEGKTTFGLAVVAAISLRQSFLDWQGNGGRALVIDAEQGLKTVQRRLREAGLQDSEEIDYARVPDGLTLDQNAAHIDALEQLLEGGQYSVVLADPLYKLHCGDSNDERQAVDLMRRFDGWRERYGFALVLPAHCRKTPPGAKFSLQEFFGSTAYLRGAEIVLGLKLVRNGYSHLHFFKDRDGDLPIGDRWGLLFDREQGFRRDPEDQKPKQTAAGAVREILTAQPGMTLNQLVETTGYAERTVRKALNEIDAQHERPGSRAERLWSVEEES
jgi:hypothetical protein